MSDGIKQGYSAKRLALAVACVSTLDARTLEILALRAKRQAATAAGKPIPGFGMDRSRVWLTPEDRDEWAALAIASGSFSGHDRKRASAGKGTAQANETGQARRYDGAEYDGSLGLISGKIKVRANSKRNGTAVNRAQASQAQAAGLADRCSRLAKVHRDNQRGGRLWLAANSRAVKRACEKRAYEANKELTATRY